MTTKDSIGVSNATAKEMIMNKTSYETPASQILIDSARRKYHELEPDADLDWRSFYIGYLEGYVKYKTGEIMKTFEVTVRDTSSRHIQIEADNAEEAIEIARSASSISWKENQDVLEEVIRVEVIE